VPATYVLRKCLPTVCLGLLVFLTGCGDKAVPLYPVTGQVMYQGKPAANAQVVFHDKRPADSIHNLPIPRARTDEQGKFQLSSYQPDDGAPAGEYAVTVMLASIKPADLAPPGESQESADPEAAGVQVPVAGKQYMDPATSGLEAVVLEQENVIPPFELE
jgi:hypothetical protein